MANMSDAERELLKTVGVEVIGMVINLIKTARAKGVDLEALMEKARRQNEVTIFDEN